MAVIRLEELCPFPAGRLQKEISSYPNVEKFIWAQEEPRNMGAWNFVNTRFENILGVKVGLSVPRELLKLLLGPHPDR